MNIEELQRLAYPTADRFEAFPLELTDAQRDQVAAQSSSSLGRASPRIWTAHRSGQRLGYLVVDDVLGKHDYITFGFSILMDGSLGKLEILEYREAKGGEVTRPDWKRQFEHASLTSGIELDAGIQNISGATLSCKHITDRVRAWLHVHRLFLS